MKELSIEEKAKAYDEALKVANKYKDTHIMFPSIKDEMFPELKENEDERIRKELIAMVKLSCTNGDDVDKKIAWLEKQGEQKLPIKKLPFEMITPEESLGIDSDTYNKIVDECIYGEQKPAVIIPKFSVGDEIKTGNEEPLTITKVDEKGY